MLISTWMNATFCCIVFHSKSWEIFHRSPNSVHENIKPIQTRWNKYNLEKYSQKWIRPMYLHKRVCLYFHSLWNQSFGRCMRVAQKHVASVEFKSRHIWFSLLDRSYIWLVNDFQILHLQA